MAEPEELDTIKSQVAALKKLCRQRATIALKRDRMHMEVRATRPCMAVDIFNSHTFHISALHGVLMFSGLARRNGLLE